MPIIASTINDTIKRLGDDCLDDLMFLYDKKSKNKNKENLLTIYLNTKTPDNDKKIEKLLNEGYLIQKNNLCQRATNSVFKYLMNNPIHFNSFEIEKGEIKESYYQVLTSHTHLKFEALNMLPNPKVVMYNKEVNLLDKIWSNKKLDGGQNKKEFIDKTFNVLSELIINQQLKIEDFEKLQTDKYLSKFSYYHYGTHAASSVIKTLYLNKVKEVEKKYFESILATNIQTKKRVKI